MRSLGGVALLCLLQTSAWGAYSMGSNNMMPSLITCDDASLFSASYIYSASPTGLDSAPQALAQQESLSTETLKLSTSMLFADHWQLGAVIPVIQDEKSAEEEDSSVGDVSMDLAYEYMAELDSSSWRPKGIGFLQLGVPTGKFNYQSQSLSELDSRGRGFYTLSAGTVFAKARGAWDVLSLFEVHHGFARDYSGLSGAMSGRVLEVRPGFGESLSVGGGFNQKDFRLGASLSYNHEDPTSIDGIVVAPGTAGASLSTATQWVTAGVSFSYEFEDQWVSALSYNDQTLLGGAANSGLSRSVQLTLTHKIEL